MDKFRKRGPQGLTLVAVLYYLCESVLEAGKGAEHGGISLGILEQKVKALLPFLTDGRTRSVKRPLENLISIGAVKRTGYRNTEPVYSLHIEAPDTFARLLFLLKDKARPFRGEMTAKVMIDRNGNPLNQENMREVHGIGEIDLIGAIERQILGYGPVEPMRELQDPVGRVVFAFTLPWFGIIQSRAWGLTRKTAEAISFPSMLWLTLTMGETSPSIGTVTSFFPNEPLLSEPDLKKGEVST